MTENEKYISEIKKRLSRERFEHSLEVAKTAAELARRYGADPEKAYAAGILHDIMKDADNEEHLRLFERNSIKLTELEKGARKLWHAMSSALYVRERFGIEDGDILGPIRYHTTGRPEMTTAEKVLFIADFISADRIYPGVERMREKAAISLELAMVEGLQFTMAELLNAEEAVHPDMLNAYNELIIKRQEKN